MPAVIVGAEGLQAIEGTRSDGSFNVLQCIAQLRPRRNDHLDTIRYASASNALTHGSTGVCATMHQRQRGRYIDKSVRTLTPRPSDLPEVRDVGHRCLRALKDFVMHSIACAAELVHNSQLASASVFLP